jgi:hypothetical protein
VRSLKADERNLLFGSEKCLAQCLILVSQSCLVLTEVARGQSLFLKSRKPLNKKPSEVIPRVSNWVQGLDLNQRPSGYEPEGINHVGRLVESDPRRIDQG